jgi:hypothetical protein
MGTRIHGSEGDDQFCANAELDPAAVLAVEKSQYGEDGEDVLVAGAGGKELHGGAGNTRSEIQSRMECGEVITMPRFADRSGIQTEDNLVFKIRQFVATNNQR